MDELPDEEKTNKANRRKNNSNVIEKLKSGRLSNVLKVFMALVLWKYVYDKIKNITEKTPTHQISQEKDSQTVQLTKPAAASTEATVQTGQTSELGKTIKTFNNANQVISELCHKKYSWLTDITTELFEDKMGEMLEVLYDKSGGTDRLKEEVKNCVQTLPEPIAEATVDDTQLDDLPNIASDDLTQKSSLQFLTDKVLYSYKNFFKNEYLEPRKRFVPGEKLLQSTQENLKDLKDLTLYQITQAASQFNGLESINEEHSPLYLQSWDRTQGPTVCSQSLPSWIKREAMYEDGTLPDFAKPLLEKLKDNKIIYYNDTLHAYYPKHCKNTGSIPKRPFYKNGYLRPSTLNEDETRGFAQLIATQSVSYMSQEAIDDKAKQPFKLSFGAAMCYQDETITYTPETYAMNYMIVYPQYENILKDAKRISKKLGEKYLVVLHLTAIGQGAFKNPPGIQHVAMKNAAQKLGLLSENSKNKPLRVIYHWKNLDTTTETAECTEKINQGFNKLNIIGWKAEEIKLT